MEITLDKIDNNEALIKINLKQEDYQPAVDKKVKDYSKTANIKGFRQGKVPQGLIKKMYGRSLVVDEVNNLISKELMDYLRNSDLQFLGEPLPKMEESAIDWENDTDFEFQYEIGYADEFEMKIDKVKAERHHIKIDEAVVNETIENLQRQFGEPEVAETVAEKDFVYGQVTSTDEKINQELRIDTREVEKATLKKFVGAKIDDSISIDLKKLYANKTLLRRQVGMTEEDFKKVKTKGTIEIKGIQRIKELPIDQTLFDKTFGAGAVESLDVFKERVKDIVAKNYEQEEKQYFQFKLREQLIDKAKIQLPDGFLKKWLKETNKEMTDELLATEYTHYANELKWSLIRNKIVKDNDFQVSQDEVMAEAKALIRQQFMSSGISEGIEDHLDSFAQNYLNAENGDNYMKVYNQVQNTKVMQFLEEQISIKDKEVTLDAFRQLD